MLCSYYSSFALFCPNVLHHNSFNIWSTAMIFCTGLQLKKCILNLKSYQSTIILKVRFFFTSINWPSVNEKLDWWNSVHILTTLTSDHKKILNVIGHHLRELLDFGHLKSWSSFSSKSNNSRKWWPMTFRIFLWSLVRVVNMCTEFHQSSFSFTEGQFIEVKKKRTLRIIIDW